MTVTKIAKASYNIAVYRDRYPSTFLTPRKSRHNIIPVTFAPLNLLTPKLDGITLMRPMHSVDLVHAHNRIPIGVNNFIITFESHLPRQFSFRKDNWFTRYMLNKLLHPSCSRIVAMSEFAKRCFLDQHAGNSELEHLVQKLQIRYPNVVVPSEAAIGRREGGNDGVLSLVFVGSHFGRKGGCVAVKVAEKAAAQKLPIHITIISSLAVGGNIWTDPTDKAFFEPYIKLLSQPNITFYSTLPNTKVLDLFSEADFCLLPTFADTFGYTAIEAMARGTPVIGTRVCALPEFIKDGENGILLDLETTPLGEWKNPGWDARGTQEYEKYFRDQVEKLTDELILRLENCMQNRDRLLAMRLSAYNTAKKMFDAESASAFWDNLYNQVVEH